MHCRFTVFRIYGYNHVVFFVSIGFDFTFYSLCHDEFAVFTFYVSYLQYWLLFFHF